MARRVLTVWPGRVARTALEGTADKGDVADDIEQFVACGLVVPAQGLLVDEAVLRDMDAGSAHHVGDMVEVLLVQGRVVDDDGIVEVAALDEVGLDELLNLAHEDECAAGGDLLAEVLEVLKGGVLVAQDGRVVVDFDVHRELVVGEHHQLGAGFLVDDLDFVADDKELLVGGLLHEARLLYLFHELDSAAVEDRHLGTVDLDEDVVDTGGIEGGHAVLDGADGDIAGCDDGASVGVDDIFGDGLYHGHALDVGALKGIAVVFGSGQKGGLNVKAGMQAFAADCERVLECKLLHCKNYVLFQ